MTISYIERALVDPELADFLAAEIGRAHVELNALRAEHAHARIVIEDQARRIRELEAAARTKGKK